MPNILLIMVDQLRYDCVGFSRRYPVHTPNIDRLAREGAWFTEAYTPIPLCSPARQCFLAGRRAEALGTLWNYNLGPKIPALDPDEFVWPRELKSKGYRNAHIGKWHVHPKLDPLSYGYDDYVSERAYAEFRRSLLPEAVKKEGHRWHYTDPVPLASTRTHWLADRAIEQLGRYAGGKQPWHIRLDYTDPHPPYHPVEEFERMYPPDQVPEWHNFADSLERKPYIQRQQLVNWRMEAYAWSDWAPIVARYYALITQTDAAIGKVLDAMDRMGESENTIVIFTSDHGDLCGSHRMFDKHYVLYDDIVKVPLAIRWPGHIPAGLRCDKMVYNMLDLPPTLLDWVRSEKPGFLHGHSLLPLLSGEDSPGWRREIVSTYNGQQFGLYTQRMIRTREWKYIWNPTDIDELYDLKNDPGELRNVIHEEANREQVRDLRERLYRLLHAEGDTLVHNLWMKDQLLNSRKL